MSRRSKSQKIDFISAELSESHLPIFREERKHGGAASFLVRELSTFFQDGCMLYQWRKQRKYGEVLRVCFPLVMSMSATTVMEFTDRVFLSNYSIDAISAVAPAGITAFLFMVFFGGVAGYTQVFIAQYFGAGRNAKIASTLWQGIYFSLFSGLVFWLLSISAAKPIFSLAGHPAEIAALEEIYFNILCRGAVLHVLMNCLSSFFSGRGITRPVMIFHCIGMLINIPLDYALIYGAWGLPELGVKGAALATVASWLCITVLLVSFIFTKENIKRYQLLTAVQFDRELFLRLLKYGIPGSLQFTLDILAFTIFILLVGRIGILELAATNIVISINALAFMPSMGVSQGVSVLVGQALGRGNPRHALRITWSAIQLLLAYILVIDLLFIFYPQQILALFIPAGQSPEHYAEIVKISTNLLRIVAAYLFIDAMYMVFAGVLRGAGDTRFIMWCIGLASFTFMIAPVYLGVVYLNFTVEQAWYCVLIFITILFLIVSLRYRHGKWREMLVIEREEK
jgi:MATE family multidrug resistance protein